MGLLRAQISLALRLRKYSFTENLDLKGFNPTSHYKTKSCHGVFYYVTLNSSIIIFNFLKQNWFSNKPNSKIINVNYKYVFAIQCTSWVRERILAGDSWIPSFIYLLSLVFNIFFHKKKNIFSFTAIPYGSLSLSFFIIFLIIFCGCTQQKLEPTSVNSILQGPFAKAPSGPKYINN